ncbi:MAG: hypothetical protein ACOYLT_09975 [Flavobacterium sp.]
MKIQDNYMDLLEHFKVEELKERLEFDMAAEAAGWKKDKVKPTAKVIVKDGKAVGGEGGAKIKLW